MEDCHTYRFDIFEIYRRFCDIQSGNSWVRGEECYIDDHELMGPGTSSTRKALDQLLKFVQSRLHSGLKLLMWQDFDIQRTSEVDVTPRADAVSRAVTAWRLVLRGWFRQLDSWCDFVEKNQRHNISHDTWNQVMAFSRCVRENLEGYDAEGAWPVLIDEFVEHIYRLSENSNFCNCGDLESQSFNPEDRLSGLQIFPGLKRKLPENSQDDDAMEVSGDQSFKKTRFSENEEERDERCLSRHNNTSLGCSKSPCAVEGCLSKGIAGLFSTRSYLQFDRERRTSFM